MPAIAQEAVPALVRDPLDPGVVQGDFVELTPADIPLLGHRLRIGRVHEHVLEDGAVL